mmetsp:Transcript_46029/g.144374  ORF Transcript_46029/g.144374 Transcript_46029/m.144374 type:complete len:472 (-) Transcript_46029:25-1440(-)
MKRISLACKPCKDIKSKCDNFQPCTRCVQSNIADQCIRLRVARGARKRSTVACIPCKRAKLKCDEERPCSRCKRLGREWDCIDEQLELIQSQLVDLNEDQFDRLDVLSPDRPSRVLELQVERPLNYRARSMSFQEPSLLRERMNSMGWPDRVLARHWEFGHSSRDMMNIFVCLPPYMQDVTRRALQALEIIIEDAMAKRQAQLLAETTTVSAREVELERTFYEQQEYGVMSQHVYSGTGKRAHAYVSGAACHMMGLHVEEVLARIANRELPLLSTELNYLVYVMYGTWSFAMYPGRPLDLITPIRVRGEHGESCVMVRMVQQQQFDSHGSLKSIKSFLHPVSKEDFESRLLNAADPFVRLLKIINLDRERSYDRWMSDFDADMYAGETILGMQKSKEGQERLLALSRELETLYGPFVARAEQILQQRLRELSTEQPVTAVNVMHKLPGQFQPPVSATGQSETLRPTMSEGT